MKKIFLLLLVSLLLVSANPVQSANNQATPEFASAVETYIMVEFMVIKHMNQDMLAYKILHALCFGSSMDDIYQMIPIETNGNIPEIFKPYY